MNIMALCPWLGNFFVKKKFSGKNSVKLEIAQKISNFFKIAIFENCTFFLILDHYAFSVWIFAALSILILNITNNIQIVDAVPQPGEVNIFLIIPTARSFLKFFLIPDIFF